MSNGGIILTTYNTRSLGYTRATTWATYLSTHNRTIPFRKANYSETLVNDLYGLTCDIDNTTTSVLSANFVQRNKGYLQHRWKLGSSIGNYKEIQTSIFIDVSKKLFVRHPKWRQLSPGGIPKNFWVGMCRWDPGTPGGHLRNFWVGMCRWDPGTLNLYQS